MKRVRNRTMRYTSAEIDERLKSFSELLSYNSDCFIWTYDTEGTLISSNSPDPSMDILFRSNACFRFMTEHVQDPAPLMLSSNFGLVWGVVYETEENETKRIHVMGPVLSREISPAQMEHIIGGRISPKWKPRFLEFMKILPVLSPLMFVQRIMMMQHCITGEKVTVSDVILQKEKEKRQRKKSDEPEKYADRIQVYMSEQSLLNVIRRGDLNYKSIIDSASRNLLGKERLSSNALQDAKLGQAQFIALCAHAAIEGGLSAETAYNRKDAYIQEVESAQSVTEVSQIGRELYADFVQLVHKQKNSLPYSKPVQSTCDYIQNHLGEKLSAGFLAERVGYADYYLSRIFKKETGISIDEYTRNARVERAKVLLVSTKDSIQDIAAALGFGERNYFSVTFKKVTGIPPAAYRKKHLKM